MVATVTKSPRLLHYNDLGEAEQTRTLPVVHCRSCGGAGWVTQQPNDARRSLAAEPGDIYKTYFGYSDRLRFIFREAPMVRRTGGGKNSLPGRICGSCLAFQPGEGEGEADCPSCKGKDTTFRFILSPPDVSSAPASASTTTAPSAAARAAWASSAPSRRRW